MLVARSTTAETHKTMRKKSNQCMQNFTPNDTQYLLTKEKFSHITITLNTHTQTNQNAVIENTFI